MKNIKSNFLTKHIIIIFLVGQLCSARVDAIYVYWEWHRHQNPVGERYCFCRHVFLLCNCLLVYYDLAADMTDAKRENFQSVRIENASISAEEKKQL